MSQHNTAPPSSLALRRSRSLDITSSRSELSADSSQLLDGVVRHARSMDAAASPNGKKLDKYGFIVNMDSNGHVFEDSLVEEKIPTFQETQTAERRVKKWNGMMKSWENTTTKRRKLLHKRLRKGIPSNSLRRTVWPLLGNVPKRMNEQQIGLYQELVDKSELNDSPTNNSNNNSSHSKNGSYEPYSKTDKSVIHTRSFQQTQETIERDIHRTYPRHSMFHEESGADSDDDLLGALDDPEVNNIIAELEGKDNGTPKSADDSEQHAWNKGGQAALRRVLRAYSVYDREVGYCQGMNFIAGMFLTFMSEEESFWLLVAVMNDPPCRMRGLFGEGMRETHCVLYIAEKLTHKFLPKLARHLEKEHVHITMYATQWLLTLYTSSFPFDLVTRVWDCFLAEGWKIVYRVMLALLQQSMPELMALSFEEILAYFRDLPDKVIGMDVVETALKIPLKRKHIEKFEKEWRTKQQHQQQQ